MSMKPILFNTEMVKAIQDGRKTVTRRIIKPQPGFFYDYGGKIQDPDNPEHIAFLAMMPDDHEEIYVPQFQPDDILYVRETWAFDTGDADDEIGTGYFAYRADDLHHPDCKWRPSIHMPKEAARIFLRVTRVSVERLQAITNKEAIREGFDGVPCDCANKDEHGCVDCFNTGWIEPPAMYFMDLWDSTIKPADLDKYGWDANPWVWVIEFERCEKPKEDLHGK